MPNYNLERGSVQWGFNKSRAKIQIMGGAFANGKTTAAVIKALSLARDYPGSEGLIARSTYPKLNDTIRKEFYKWCPPSWIKRKHTDKDNTVILMNGSVINFRYIGQKGKSSLDGQTSSNLLSATYDWIIVDQIEDPEIVHKDFLDLLGRLRGETPYRPPEDAELDDTMPSTGPRWLILTANPNFGWFYTEVVRPFIIWRDKGTFTPELIVDEETGLPLLDLFEGDTYSNKANLKPDFIKTLEATYKGQMRDRFLKGKWAAYEGLVHPTFDVDKHMLPREFLMDYVHACRGRHVKMKVVEGYDFGIAVPSCYLFSLVDDFGRVLVLDGFHKAEFDYTQQPDAIREIRSQYYWFQADEPIEADPGIFRRIPTTNRQTSKVDTIARIFAKDNIHTRAADNTIITGLAKVNAYLNGLPDLPHLLSGDKPSPLIYFAEELDWISTEFNAYYWKKNPRGENVDEPQDGNDDAMNTIKYMLTRRPEPSQIVVPKGALPPKWMFWHEQEDSYAG